MLLHSEGSELSSTFYINAIKPGSSMCMWLENCVNITYLRLCLQLLEDIEWQER